MSEDQQPKPDDQQLNSESEQTNPNIHSQLQNNRDFNRINRATTTIQANIQFLVACDSLNEVKKTLKRKLDVIVAENDKIETSRQIELLDLALQTNNQSRDLFNRTQQAMTKQIAERYSQNQHNLMIRSTRQGEDISTIDSVSQSINTPEVSDLYKELVGHYGREEKHVAEEVVQDVDTNQEEDALDEEELAIIQEEDALDNFLDAYCRSGLTITLREYYYILLLC